MAAAITKYTNSGWFKDRYADAPAKVLGQYTQFKKEFPFEKRKKLGLHYHQAVQLTRPDGFTYPSANATEYTTLVTPVAMAIGDAYLEGSEIIGRQWLTYKQVESSRSSEEAFGTSADLVVAALMDEIDRKRELDIIDGTKGLGDTTTGTADDSTSETVTFSARSWSTARWFGTENQQYQFYDGSSLVSSSTNSIFTVSSVDSDNHTITFTGTSTGCTALHTAVTTTGTSLAVYPYGAYGCRMKGLNDIATATSTALWGITPNSYSCWKGQSHTVGQANGFTKTDLFNICAKATDKGATGEMVVALPTVAMSHLLDDLSDLQRFAEAKGKSAPYEVGANGVKVFTPNAGVARILTHPQMRDGEGYAFPAGKGIRIGATEFTWGKPGRSEGDGDFLRENDLYDVYELRAYADEAIFLPAPAQVVKIISTATTTTL